MKCKVILFLTIILSACTSPKLALDTEKVSFNELLDYIQTGEDELKTLEASCRISVDSEEFSGNFFANLYYIKEDSLLLSVSGPFGIHAGSLFIGKDRFIFYNQMSNKFYNGSIKDFENKNLFQFPLKMRELINIFAAKEKLPSLKIEDYKIDDGQYYINAKNGSDNYEIWVDNLAGRISKLSLIHDGEVAFTREYGDFMTAGKSYYFPRKITMLRPSEKEAVSVYYTNLSINEEIEREKFIINIADNAEQMLLFK
jgi:outer membrane lipoprotein-sorting protein